MNNDFTTLLHKHYFHSGTAVCIRFVFLCAIQNVNFEKENQWHQHQFNANTSLFFRFKFSLKHHGIEWIYKKINSTHSKSIFNWWKETITSDNNIGIVYIVQHQQIHIPLLIQLVKRTTTTTTTKRTQVKWTKTNESERMREKSHRSGKPINPTEQFAKNNTLK